MAQKFIYKYTNSWQSIIKCVHTLMLHACTHARAHTLLCLLCILYILRNVNTITSNQTHGSFTVTSVSMDAIKSVRKKFFL